MTLDIEAIKARLAAATPGPWAWEYQQERPNEEVRPVIGQLRDGRPGFYYVASCYLEARGRNDDRLCTEANAALIAHAPTDLAALLAALAASEARAAAAEAEAARLREAVERIGPAILREQWVAALSAALDAATGPTPAAERGAALLAVVEIGRKIAAADSLAQIMDWQDDLDAALRRYEAAACGGEG